MSALGHKRTCAVQKGMSALPPQKADMCGATSHVRFGPKADILCSNVGYCGNATTRGRMILISVN